MNDGALPSGVVTFLFTDIEGSTRLWEEHPDAMRAALARHDDGRALVRELMRTPADLHPDLQAKTLTVRLHPLPSRLQDAAVRHLAEELTATETAFPGTDLRLVFSLDGPF